MTHDEMIAVIAAHKAGKRLIPHGLDGYKDAASHFNLYSLLKLLSLGQTVTIAPEPKYRPWQTVDEVPVGKVVRKLDSSRMLIVGCGIRVDGVCVMIGSDNWLYAAEVLDTYTMDDGSPCGIEVKE